MSKSQLQTNNTRLASLIEELKGKATGGGGSVETCYIKFNIPIPNCWYVAHENGAIVTKTLTNVARGTIVEAVCNTVVYFDQGEYGASIEPNSQLIYIEDHITAILSAESGGTVFIEGVLEL